MPASSEYVSLTYDPFVGSPTVDGMGRLHSMNPHYEFGGVYVENWAVENYGTVSAALGSAHVHYTNTCYHAPLRCMNNSISEDQHPWGTTLQGILVAMPSGAPFDLVSIDYRRRQDADPSHVQQIPGILDTDPVEIWVACGDETLSPMTAVFTRVEVGPRIPQMSHFETLFAPAGCAGATRALVTSTWEVSFDEIVLDPN